MMTEKQLIGRIRELRRIQPRKDWVFSLKSRILGEDQNLHRALVFDWRLFYKPALVGVSALVLLGLFVSAQNSLPGDFLYSIKKITERGQAIFVSEEGKPKAQLELVNKKLEELNQIVQNNEVKKLAPAISELQANVSEAAKNLANIGSVDKETVDLIKKFEENKIKVEKVLAAKILSEETKESLDKVWAEILIKDLAGRSLTERQELLLTGAKEDFELGNYDLALEKIWFASNPSNQ